MQLLIIPPVVSPKLSHPLGHGWTSFVVQELRADSLIALLTLSELKIAVIHKMWPWSVLQVLQAALQVRICIVQVVYVLL